MAISFEKAFGLHPEAMLVRDRRAQVLAENIANADTPGYKAKDIDFQQALSNAKARQSGAINRTHEQHFNISIAQRQEAMFRNPDQPDTGDGNSVDIHRERNAFMQNSLEYQASMTFLNARISGLKKAINGGGQ
ncbi:MAG: flagellar basal-body rod protein FlgB [Rheinheimera aquimaris]|jgi:flagellar basal-body rod protein FlgB|uniref:flagellar basal body rod protein FlgB n=1 Tax=Rheinheimera aquimaris TaxID=412437 RepID=UPI0039E508F6